VSTPDGTAPGSDLAEGAAVAQCVEGYEQAWSHGDFERLAALTTDRLRRDLEVETELPFAEASAGYVEGSEGLSSVVTGISVDGDHATVVTTETSRDGADHVVEKVAHHLIRSGALWRIDAVDVLDA
jgi:hypothetical protein